MSKFLAIDFGTSNSSAAIINARRELEFVPLDGDSFFLPSAIFVQVSEATRGSIDEARIKLNAERLHIDEQKRYRQDVEISKRRYRDFYKTYVPMAINPDRPYRKNSLRKYVHINDLESAVENFKNNALAEEKKRILAEIKPAKELNEILSDLRTKYELAAVQDDIDLLADESFFTAVLNANSKIYFGTDALKRYVESPLSGFFLRSPKAFLGTSLNSRSKELFIRIVSLILEQIKAKSESCFEMTFTSVVFGRPVHYLGSESEFANEQALSIMSAAALRVGFSDIRYVIEPCAAALVSRRTMFSTKTPSIIVDIGGGTTDVAIIAVGEEENDSLKIIASGGSRVGGDDFDQSIAFKYFTEILKQNVYEFHAVTVDALSTRDLQAQARFAKAGQNIVEVLARRKIPIKNSYLFDLYRGQLQHKAILLSEKIKMQLGKESSFNFTFDFLSSSLNINQKNVEFKSICTRQFDQIEKIINQAYIDSKLEINSARKVFITGGMSNSEALIEVVKRFFPLGSVFYRLSPLNTIITGLAVAANHLSIHEINRPLAAVYGVPIERYA